MKKNETKSSAIKTLFSTETLKLIPIVVVAAIVIFCSCSDDEIIFQSRPIADAGDDQLVNVFDTVYLNKDKGRLTENAEYIWTFKYKPVGSKVCFSDSSSPNPTFIPDIAGYYYVQLMIRVGDEYSEPDYSLINVTYQKSEEYFPNSVGSKWIYKTSNSSTNLTDSITFEVVGNTILPNNKFATVWVSDINTRIYLYSTFDTLYFSMFEDTLVYYNCWDNYQFRAMVYLVPFSVGDTISGFGTTVFVKEEGPAMLFFVASTTGFLVVEYRPGNNYSLTTYSLFVPYVGLIKRDMYEFDFGGFYDEHWELIWYHLEE